MKLKYYLRGLAAGILFSVLVFVFIVGPKESELSDEEIIQRAKQLGMKEVNIDMEKLRDNTASGQKGEGTTPTGTVAELPSTGTPTPTPTLSPTPFPATPTPEPADSSGSESPTPTLVPTSTPTPFPTDILVPTDTPVAENTAIIIEVKRGMTSENVAYLLENNGVVENAMSLNTYLISNGYAEQLRIGKFSLHAGMTFEEIAAVLTK